MTASNLRTVRNATILSGASLSAALKTGGERVIGFQLPAAWTAANLTFQGSNDDSTYQNVYTENGVELVVAAAASRNVAAAAALILGAFSSIKVRSGTSGTAVNQGADRVVGVVTTSGPYAVLSGGNGGVSTGTASRPTAAGTATGAATQLAANAARSGATIFNEGAAIAYVLLGTGASTTNYSYQIAVLGVLELPYGYTGIVTAVTASGTAQLQVTEYTA